MFLILFYRIWWWICSAHILGQRVSEFDRGGGANNEHLPQRRKVNKPNKLYYIFQGLNLPPKSDGNPVQSGRYCERFLSNISRTATGQEAVILDFRYPFSLPIRFLLLHSMGNENIWRDSVWIPLFMLSPRRNNLDEQVVWINTVHWISSNKVLMLL